MPTESENFEFNSLSSLQDSLKVDPVVLKQAEEAQQQRLQFDAEFLELQNPNSSSGRLLYVFIRRELQGVNLHRQYKEAYILNEAYVRSIQKIATGTVIRNTNAWVKKMAFNIIRELNRERKKTVSLDQDVPEEAHPTVDPAQLEDDFVMLRAAFQLLPPYQQRLLNLRIVEKQSWKDIREILRREGYKDEAEPNLRKRKERALTQLRKKFHALTPHDFK